MLEQGALYHLPLLSAARGRHRPGEDSTSNHNPDQPYLISDSGLPEKMEDHVLWKTTSSSCCDGTTMERRANTALQVRLLR